MAGNSEEKGLKYSAKLAFCGIMSGISVVLLLTGGLIPGAAYCAPLMAALVLIPVRLECGPRWGWLCWAGTALVALMAAADRETAFFYGFIGYYPLLAPLFRRIKNGFLRLMAKAALFAAANSAMYAFLCLILRLDAVIESFSSTGKLFNFVFFLGLILCLLLYDRALAPLTRLYCRRIRPKLHLHR